MIGIRFCPVSATRARGIVAGRAKYFTLVTVLAPGHSQKQGSKRFLRREKFDGDLRRFLFDLKSVTPVVVTGDFKVAAEDVDAHPSYKIHYDTKSPPKLAIKKVWIFEHVMGYEPPAILWIPLQIDPELRRRFKGYLFDGLLDALTFFRTSSDIYTCWPMSRALPDVADPLTKRQQNIGWRTDYFLMSPALKDRVQSCTVLKDIMGSRNAPIKLVLDLPEPNNPPPIPPPEPEVPNQPAFDWDQTYTGGDPSNPYFVSGTPSPP